MNNFHDMGLPVSIIRSLEKMKCNMPTPIQVLAIPFALQDRDILGSAQTGTGKTLAFAIPLVNKLLKYPKGTALVLAPTRELALQVMNAIKQLLNEHSQLRATLLIGGESIYKQSSQLKSKPRILVGTPGRVIDHMSRGTLRGEDITFLVLDEMDRMFDMGFGIQIEKIMSRLPKSRQTLMFSATLPSNIANLAQKYLSHPERVSTGSVTAPATKIKQEIIRVAETEKYKNLLTQIENREGSIIVFVNTKRGAEKLAERLREKSHNASAIHGDLRQQKRSKIISAFRAGRSRIMVATDIAARGLDIPIIQTVINYELPQCPEDYIHRIGRTARAGAEGSAVCLLTPQEGRRWFMIEKLINPNRVAHPDDNNGPASSTGKGRRGRGGSNSKGRGFNERRKFRGRNHFADRSYKSDSDSGSSDNGVRYRAPREEGYRNEGRRSERAPREGSYRSEGRSERTSREGSYRSEGRSERTSREGSYRSEGRSERTSRGEGYRGESGKGRNTSTGFRTRSSGSGSGGKSRTNSSNLGKSNKNGLPKL